MVHYKQIRRHRTVHKKERIVVGFIIVGMLMNPSGILLYKTYNSSNCDGWFWWWFWWWWWHLHHDDEDDDNGEDMKEQSFRVIYGTSAYFGVGYEVEQIDISLEMYNGANWVEVATYTSGSFTCTGIIPEEQYRLVATDSFYGFSTYEFSISSSGELGSPLDLTVPTRHLTAHVEYTDGTAYEGDVDIYHFDGVSFVEIGTKTTDALGDVDFGGLIVGTYKIKVGSQESSDVIIGKSEATDSTSLILPMLFNLNSRFLL